MGIPRYRSADAWPLLSAGFRPFFLAAGLWAAVSMALWILMLRGSINLPTAFDPVTWHFHELLFGFVAAAIAGFLLTAIPNWTGRLPLQNWPLAMLVLLWLLGRIAVACSALTGPVLAMTIDLSFLIVFAALVAREIIAGRNWRNLPVLVALVLLIAANAMLHVGALGYEGWDEPGEHLSIAIVVMLIALIGGRIIPSFTTNWLRRKQVEPLPVPFNRFDKAALAFTILALVVWVIVEFTVVSGIGLIIAGMLHGVRLARWRGSMTLSEPLLSILHVGYAWLPIGLVLLGLAVWRHDLETVGIHALTVGAMGTMILAVMTRASLGHTKQELTAGRGTQAVYLLVLIAAIARITAPFLERGTAAALDLAGGAWIAAFVLFVILYLPLYLRR